jgi:hypothetical protein
MMVMVNGGHHRFSFCAISSIGAIKTVASIEYVGMLVTMGWAQDSPSFHGATGQSRRFLIIEA